MTGYGRAEIALDDKNVVVEIRSLNSKTPDVRLKTSLQLGQYELELRKMILESAVRGKVDVMIDVKGAGVLEAGLPNTDMIKTYFRQLREIGSELGVEDEGLYSTVLRLPNIFQPDTGELDGELKAALLTASKSALERLRNFRQQEGKSLYEDLSTRITNIESLLGQVAGQEADREESLKDRLRQKVTEIGRESVDENRFEQEIIYYLDKLDINEEKSRLAQHCKYFMEVINQENGVKGKKLNFISQEIGREINTLGAKAQWSPIQRIVVQMKDNLENIKEQLANAL